MRYYQILDAKFTSEINSPWGQDESSDLPFNEMTLKQYRKLISQFKTNDWKALTSNWFDKPTPWKKRILIALEFAAPSQSVPLLISIIASANLDAKLLHLAGASLSKIDLENSGLDAHLIERAKQVLEKPGAKSQIQNNSEKLTPELALKLKTKIYSQKSLGLDRLIIWSDSTESLHLEFISDDVSLAKMNAHLNAGIELAKHFGTASRIYPSSSMTKQDLISLNGKHHIKSLHLTIDDSIKTLETSFEIEDSDAFIKLGCERAKEVSSRLLKPGWMEPPYTGWEIIEDHYKPNSDLSNVTGSLFLKANIKSDT